MNTNELFETISEGLVQGESNGNFGVSEGLLNPEDIDCSEALAALATLRQRVADLEAFYQHMEFYGLDTNELHRMQRINERSVSTSESVQDEKDFAALLERLQNGT